MASTSGPPNFVMITAVMLQTIVVERDLLALGRRKASHEGHEGLTKNFVRLRAPCVNAVAVATICDWPEERCCSCADTRPSVRTRRWCDPGRRATSPFS